jgi:hypothetical protein
VTREVVTNLKDGGAGWGLIRTAESLADKPAEERSDHARETSKG